MKTFYFWLISLIISVFPITGKAQTSIKSAFDAIINCPEAVITESHSLEKDPGTNIKTSQYDGYSFELPASKMPLIRKVISAFGNDSERAFSIEQGKTRNQIALAIGDGTKTVTLATEGYDYIYALFLPSSKEDKEGIYRYAYGMSFMEEKGKITGCLVITYATTLKYRQELDQKQNEESADGNGTQTEKGWFETMMSYLQGMYRATPQTRIALATKAFQLIQEADKDRNVSMADKNAIREILKGMISYPEYSETILNALLNQCLVVLK